MQEIVSLRKRYKKMTIQRKWEPVLCMIILTIFWFYFLNYLKNSLTDTYKPPMPPHFHLPLQLSADALLFPSLGVSTIIFWSLFRLGTATVSINAGFFRFSKT